MWGMIERSHRARLTLEARGELVARHFDRHGAPQPRVRRPVDVTHAARTERSDDFIGTETGAWARVTEVAGIIEDAHVDHVRSDNAVVFRIRCSTRLTEWRLLWVPRLSSLREACEEIMADDRGE